MSKEVELTARLSAEECTQLRAYLSPRFYKVADQRRFMIRFFKGKVDVRVPLDIRYKWTNGANELVVKQGALGSQSREEVTIPLGERSQVDQLVYLFSSLGFDYGVAIYREIERFRNEKLEIAVVTGCPYYFVEVESIAANRKSDALRDVSAFFADAGLEALSRSAYQAFQRLLTREVNLTFALADFPSPFMESPVWRDILQHTMPPSLSSARAH